jgi:hypothetical protein
VSASEYCSLYDCAPLVPHLIGLEDLLEFYFRLFGLSHWVGVNVGVQPGSLPHVCYRKVAAL